MKKSKPQGQPEEKTRAFKKRKERNCICTTAKKRQQQIKPTKVT